MTEVRRLFTDFVGKSNIEIKSYFMGNGRKVKHAVGGASQGHIHCQRIQNGFFCHNVSGTDILSIHFHHSHAGMFCQTETVRINGRNGSVSLQSHAQGFCQAVHGIGGIHAGAGTAGGTCLLLKFTYVLFCHSSCRIRAHCLKHGRKTGLFPFHTACQHGPAGYEHRRHIDSCRRHQKPRHILITIRHHHQSVKLMSQRHTFRGIRNQITGNQGIFHAGMPHGNSVTNCNGRKYHRNAAGLCYPQLHCIYNFIQIHMPRNDFIIGAYNSN
ncbi:hypothetical protein IMSAGC013_00744 [Lachnospiraceae bacterium]|nr:hypothetical protein IMSAGC013_00744 [Lachnospiraceae bacterium]